MSGDFYDENALWRRCEVAWSAWLQARSWAVTPLTDARNNAPGIDAPMISIAGGKFRAPDFIAHQNGLSEYWEVKFRSRPHLNVKDGVREHWMSEAAFADYHEISRRTDIRVWVILYEGPMGNQPGRWMKADVDVLARAGRPAERHGQDGVAIAAWTWPASAMEVVDGPTMNFAPSEPPVLPVESVGHAVPRERFAQLERDLRGKRPEELTAPGEPAEVAIRTEHQYGLEVLATTTLGLPRVPAYSVVRIGDISSNHRDVLGLMHYGIRLFLVVPEFDPSWFDADVTAFRDARLLEVSVDPSAGGTSIWGIDGRFDADDTDVANDFLEGANARGDINLRQFEVVHAPADSDVVVTAGAGTGKTETMSERVVFLLATDAGSGRNIDLRMDDFVLVTFTREAAGEIRKRLTLTLGLRLRLCRNCALPALAWLMDLSSTEISTIHSYAKSIAQRGAGKLGLSPAFSVSSLTMKFREELHAALSRHLEDLYVRYDVQGGGTSEVPPVHEWRKHVELVWEALDNNGVDLMAATFGGVPPVLDWGTPDDDGMNRDIAVAVTEVVQELGERFADVCLSNQAVPTSKLVSIALGVLTSDEEPTIRRPRFVFIDEFQDTDAEQMDLLLALRKRLQARLFVVGDVKQGIYRFRGAEGSAFTQLEERREKLGLPPMAEFGLTRNFRSGPVLLESLHPFFAAWGAEGILDYDPNRDRLLADPHRTDPGLAVQLIPVGFRQHTGNAVSIVARWRKDHPDASIAVLCRRNWTAQEVQQAIRDGGGSCDLRVGGDFYRTEAVRELRAFLEAVADPSDTAAVLEFIGTRWAEGLMRTGPLPGLTPAAAEEWSANQPGDVLAWRDRFRTVGATGSFHDSDLGAIRTRLRIARGVLEQMAVLGWLVQCSQHFAPAGCALDLPDDDVRRKSYARCMDHLFTLMDLEFADRPTTLARVLAWLRLQIAVNDNEDEPVDPESVMGKGATTALTVHKAKGLEFDFVLIPYTVTNFATPESVASEVGVLREDGTTRIVWRWKRGPHGDYLFSNVPPDDDVWDVERDETRKEEARLLYVAMTRARNELVVLVPERCVPDTWSELLEGVV